MKIRYSMSFLFIYFIANKKSNSPDLHNYQLLMNLIDFDLSLCRRFSLCLMVIGLLFIFCNNLLLMALLI